MYKLIINILKCLGRGGGGGEGELNSRGGREIPGCPRKYFRIFFQVPGLYRQLLQNIWTKIILIVYYNTCNFSERSKAD